MAECIHGAYYVYRIGGIGLAVILWAPIAWILSF